MSQDISSRPAGLPAKRKVYRFWGYRQGRKERGQKDICLSALPSSRSVALELLLSVALSSYRAFRLYHFGYGVPSGLNFVIKMGPFSL